MLVKKMDFVAVRDVERHWVLGRIDSIYREGDKTIAKVSVIGFKNSRGVVTPPRLPFKPGSLVYKADDFLIKRVLGLKSSGLYIGLLQNSENLKIHLDPQKIITKHMAILAKTGAGKSYLVAVMLEEFIENKIPAVVIDPHGEYTTLKTPNDNPEELKYSERFEVIPKGYKKEVEVYCLEKNLIEGAKKLKFPARLTSSEIYEMLPFRLSGAQMNIIYNALDAMRSSERKELKVRTEHHEDTGVVRISITDSGPGIPDEVGDKVFKPFFTTKKKTDNRDTGLSSGSGLGLSSSLTLLKTYGGSITYESIPGKGTTFHIVLPVSGGAGA